MNTKDKQMKVNVTLTKEEIEAAIRSSLYGKFEVKTNAKIEFKIDKGEIVSATVECGEKKQSYSSNWDDR